MYGEVNGVNYEAYTRREDMQVLHKKVVERTRRCKKTRQVPFSTLGHETVAELHVMHSIQSWFGAMENESALQGDVLMGAPMPGLLAYSRVSALD